MVIEADKVVEAVMGLVVKSLEKQMTPPPPAHNKTENQSDTCGLLKLEAVEVKVEARFGLSSLENSQVPILEDVGAT